MCSDCFGRFYNCCKLWSCWCLRLLNTQIWSLWLLPTRARLMTNQFIRIPGFDFNMSNIKHLSDPTSMHWCEERLSHVGNHQLSAVLCHDPWADLMPPKAGNQFRGCEKAVFFVHCWNQNSLCCSLAALSNLKFGFVAYWFLLHSTSISLKFLNIP